MKHKTWFRLVLKAIGVLLIGLSMPQFTGLFARFASYLFVDTAGSIFNHDYWAIQLLYYLGGPLQFVLGLYLFFGGKWIVNKAIPSNRPYCPECGYDLSNAKSERCPECGCVLPPSGSAHASD